jgi:hypothetical protein
MPIAESPKFDPALAATLSQGIDANTVLQLLVGLSRPPEPALQARLAAAGLQLGSAAGDVLSAEARVADLPAIAALPEVLRIEASRVLGADDELPFG